MYAPFLHMYLQYYNTTAWAYRPPRLPANTSMSVPSRPQPEWLPTPLSAAPGREVATLSYLGPFLRYSVLSEDDCKVIKKSYAGATNPEAVRMLHRTLQQQLELVRVRRRRRRRRRRETGDGRGQPGRLTERRVAEGGNEQRAGRRMDRVINDHGWAPYNCSVEAP